jgi:phage tail tape-measure protein
MEVFIMKTLLLVSAIAVFGLTACSATTRNAAAGGAIGAAAGAVIGNNTGSGDAQTGAIIGGVVGAAAGAYTGCREDGGCRWTGNDNSQSELYYDNRAGREYYVNSRDGCTYWRNGDRRSC